MSTLRSIALAPQTATLAITPQILENGMLVQEQALCDALEFASVLADVAREIRDGDSVAFVRLETMARLVRERLSECVAAQELSVSQLSRLIS